MRAVRGVPAQADGSCTHVYNPQNDTLTNPDLKPISDLSASVSAREQEGWAAALAIVSSMSRDYHDTRSHPMMSLEDHIADCRLTEAEASYVRERLRETGMAGRDMAQARLPEWQLKQLGAIDHHGNFDPSHWEWSMAEIRVGDGRVICFIPLLSFVDLRNLEQIYQG
jgi:hypothetical protein